MTRSKTQHLKQSFKATLLAVYLLVNIGGIIALTADWSPEGDIASHLCVGHLSLMTDVTPNIRC